MIQTNISNSYWIFLCNDFHHLTVQKPAGEIFSMPDVLEKRMTYRESIPVDGHKRKKCFRNLWSTSHKIAERQYKQWVPQRVTQSIMSLYATKHNSVYSCSRESIVVGGRRAKHLKWTFCKRRPPTAFALCFCFSLIFLYVYFLHFYFHHHLLFYFFLSLIIFSFFISAPSIPQSNWHSVRLEIVCVSYCKKAYSFKCQHRRMAFNTARNQSMWWKW